jgi:hypothetical protein
MKHLMGRSYVRAAMAGLPLLALATQASANFSGSYTLRFYLGSDHTRGAKQCVVFTQTGDVLGFPDSGTWDMPSFDGYLQGFFVVDHQHLRFYASHDSGYAINFYIKIKDGSLGRKGGFDDWRASDPPLPVDDGIFTLKVTTGCESQGPRSKTVTGRTETRTPAPAN